MRQEITDEIACDLRTELDNSRKENLRHSLLNEIEKCNSNVIFYGYQGGGGTLSELLELLRSMNVDDFADKKQKTWGC